MARCSNCGAELLDTARFCHQCGQPTGLTPDEQSTKARTIALPSDQEAGQTVFLPDDPAADDEAATTLLQNVDEGDGSTIAVADWPVQPASPTQPRAGDISPDTSQAATQQLPAGAATQPSTGTVALADVDLPPDQATVTLDSQAAANPEAESSPPVSPFDRDHLLHNRYRRLKILGRGI